MNNSSVRAIELNDRRNGHLYIWAGTALPIIYIGAFGNLLTLLAIIRSRWWKTGIQVLILSMTIADLLNTFLFYPHEIFNILYGNVYPWNFKPFCRAIGYLTMSFGLLVPLQCCMIAINRLVSIVLPRARFFHRLAHRPAAISMSIICWLIPFILFFFPLIEVDGAFGNSRLFHYCTWLGRLGSRAMSYSIFVITLYLPTAIIFICYLIIFIHLKNLERSVNHQEPGNEATEERRNLSRAKRRNQVAKMMLMTFVVFLVCYIPLTMFFYLAGNVLKGSNPTIFCWLTLVYWLGACCNPVLNNGARIAIT